MMAPLLNQTGSIPGDIVVTLIVTLVAMISYWNLACVTRYQGPWTPSAVVAYVLHACTTLYVARWMIALGWTLISVRLWHALLVHGDAPIAPISLVALSMIGSGNVLMQIKKGMR